MASADRSHAAQPPRNRSDGDRRPAILLAGATPGAASGNAVSSSVLLSALEPLGPVTHLAHQASYMPSYGAHASSHASSGITLGTQPFAIHGEALLAGAVHRRRLRAWSCGWAVNSRYAGALFAAGVPYAIWEATLTADELRSTSFAETRASGRGTGFGVLLHTMSLPIGSRLERLMYRRATVVCAMSEYTRRSIVERHNIDPRKVVLLPHPPSPHYLSALAQRRQHPRTSQATRGSSMRLLFVGRLDDPRKGVIELLQAVCRARAERMAVDLTLIGPHSDAWRRKTAGLLGAAQARVLGQVDLDRLAEEYLIHDAFVLPSRQEGFGIVVAEALHAGLPVIATRCGGPEDTVMASKAGVLVDHNAQAMVAAFRTLADCHDLRRQFRTNALEYAERELSFSVFAGRVADLTDRVSGAAFRAGVAR